MAIIAKLKASGARVIVIGTGYGAFESARASRIFGDLLPSYQSGRLGMVAVATKNGEVSWCPSHEIEIVEIDGIAVDSLLQGSDAAESAADLDFPVSSADEVRNHPQFLAFVMENRDRQYLVDGRIEIEFGEWQSRRKRIAEQAGSSNGG
jgi:hypothetical protein